MTEMAQYKEQKRAANSLHDTIKGLLAQGKSVRIASLIIELTLSFAVSERFVRQRIELLKESDKNIIEEDGELWLRPD